jgi:hypothetical protein
MNWRRLVGYGILLWLVPFGVSFVIFGLRDENRALFESLITVLGVGMAVAATLLYFRDVTRPGAGAGLMVGTVWAVISIAIDLPIFLLVFNMSLVDYMSDIALTYLSFPLIAVGTALGGGRRAS